MSIQNQNGRTRLPFLRLFALLAATSAPAVASDRVCDLITPDEAATVMGTPTPPGMASQGECGVRLCRYGDLRRVSLGVSISLGSGKQMFEKAKDAMLDNHGLNGSGVTLEPLAGLADQAVFANLGPGVSELIARKGDSVVEIFLSGRPLSSARDALKDLARKAISRL